MSTDENETGQATYTIVRRMTVAERYEIEASSFDEAVEIIDSGVADPIRAETVEESDRLIEVAHSDDPR